MTAEPTHTVTRTFVAGGTTEYPRRIVPLYDHEGVTLEAGDGTPTNVWISSKRRWQIVWESPLPAVVERWRTRYRARSTFPFTDPYGQTYTALIPAGKPPQHTIEYLPSSSTAGGTTYPGFTVEVWEA